MSFFKQVYECHVATLEPRKSITQSSH